MEVSPESSENDKQLIKKKEGCRKRLALQIAMCVGFEERMTEVSKIVPTVQGALIYVFFYGVREEKEKGWFDMRRLSQSLQPNIRSQLETPLLPSDSLKGILFFYNLFSLFNKAFVYPLLWTDRRKGSRSEEKASEEGMSNSQISTFPEDYETVYKLLSEAISSKTLFVAMQNAFGLLNLPEKITFSLGRTETDADEAKDSISNVNLQMSKMDKL